MNSNTLNYWILKYHKLKKREPVSFNDFTGKPPLIHKNVEEEFIRELNDMQSKENCPPNS